MASGQISRDPPPRKTSRNSQCGTLVYNPQIKTSMAKREFEDACAKANSVRKLKRCFPKEKARKNHYNYRRYGQIAADMDLTSPFHLDKNITHLGDILTGILTAESKASKSTIISYANAAYHNSPDFIVCLDGICAYGLDANRKFTNSRLAQTYSVNSVENPFGEFIEALYYYLINGRTTLFEDYQSYFSKR